MTVVRGGIDAFGPTDSVVGSAHDADSISLSGTAVSGWVEMPAILGSELAGKVSVGQFLGWGVPLLPNIVFSQVYLRTSIAHVLARCLSVYPSFDIRELKFPTHYFW
ncbi:MAG: hypothetical protein JJU34_12100 [Lunatimonas sp.]|uniref:hypothetical protein n=1 Tax=Lunatimonas sp. TaxID=2060141 RepID=UPI00263B7E70|nr:hypothetical protein [Lunatimonas sp.]MCC5938014.1 hypothetical protein [Lunatimonas sp.]